MRSWLGNQERYRPWVPLAEGPAAKHRCHLSASTVHRWVDKTGACAEERGPGYLKGIAQTTYAGVDGLWAPARWGHPGGVDGEGYDDGVGVSPLVAHGEGRRAYFPKLFARAQSELYACLVSVGTETPLPSSRIKPVSRRRISPKRYRA